jgi:GT2 family glycosyltransferase/glycosyltransferase involved in cell wall biosynthesis
LPTPTNLQPNTSALSTQHSALSTCDVSVIIVSYNVAGLLEECLSSLFSRPADGLEIEVIVVDNASADGSADLVREKFPQAHLIENHFNYGFPRACNQGLRRATGRYLFFLNPDATVEPGTMRALLDFMAAHPLAGIVGPLVRFPDGSPQPNRRRFPGPGLALLESTIWQRKPWFKAWPGLKRFYFEDTPDDRAQEVDWLVGAAFLVRREVVEQIDGLDERFFMYSEELDYCRRAKAQGWQVWYTPAGAITHQEGQSSQQNVAARYINFHTSKISYYRKYYGRTYAGFLRSYLLGTHLWEYAEEWAKLRLGHKPTLRQERLQMLRKVLVSRFRPYQSAHARAATDLDICLITAEYPPQPGGVGDYTACLKAALNKAGAGSVRVLINPYNLNNLKSKIQNPKWNWSCLPAIVHDLKTRPAHLINIQYQTGAYGMHPAINFLPLYLRLKMGVERPRSVTTFHDLRVPYLFPKAGPVRRWVNQLLLKTSDLAVVTNEADYRQALAWGADPDCLNLVPIGSNITPGPGFASLTERDEYRAKLGLAKTDFAVGYFGLTNHSKGVDTLLEAIAHLRQREPDWKLVIIGGEAGEPDLTNREYACHLTALIEQLKLEDAIIKTGHLPPVETSLTLLALDAMALPFRDGASFRRGSLLAPLIHGLPIITTTGQATATESDGPQLIDAQNVLLIEPDQPLVLASRLEQLRHDPALQATLAAGALELSRYFDWDYIAVSLLEIYR